jgi:hypothetical protein
MEIAARKPEIDECVFYTSGLSDTAVAFVERHNAIGGRNRLTTIWVSDNRPDITLMIAHGLTNPSHRKYGVTDGCQNLLISSGPMTCAASFK